MTIPAESYIIVEYVMPLGSDKMVKKGVASGLAIIFVLFLISPVAPAFFEEDASDKKIPAEARLFASVPVSLSHSESTQTFLSYKAPSFLDNVRKGRDSAILASGSGFSYTENECFYNSAIMPLCRESSPIKSIYTRAP